MEICNTIVTDVGNHSSLEIFSFKNMQRKLGQEKRWRLYVLLKMCLTYSYRFVSIERSLQAIPSQARKIRYKDIHIQPKFDGTEGDSIFEKPKDRATFKL